LYSLTARRASREDRKRAARLFYRESE